MAVDDELIMRNPSRKVRPFPEEIPDVHILTFEEEFKYLTLASEPLKSVAIIMLGQGMRPDEVFRMTYENLDFINRTILIVRGKTRNAKRTLSMCQEVFDLLSRTAARERLNAPQQGNFVVRVQPVAVQRAAEIV